MTPRRSIAVISALALAGCYGSLNLTPSDHQTVLANQALDAPRPSEPGSYAVGHLFYGSGTDRNRPEYRDSVAITTASVDASKLVDLGGSADERNGYWGFTPEAFPINARVWYPEGDGPFPLVLTVHGNHDMRDFSDPGYGYLGELLASRGFIFASVDMNFINGSTRGENDGRGWLLLEHLQAWRGFNEDPENPFHGRVDMSRIALMGHSRGGEAVGHAAAFNRLSRYPDDASLEFDFGFDIRSVIAIAPVDGQYLPTGRLVPVEDVNYMVFHGSHDGDVTSFHGLRQYGRVTYPNGGDFFKTAIYMYRANHGQWNTVWNSKDFGPRSERILALRGLIDPEAQREFARLYVTAFLEATLMDRDAYLPIFRDHRVIGGWLPETMYITRFQTASFRPLATFEEDIDVTTGTEPGVTIDGDSLGRWSEELLDLRSRNRPNTSSSQETNAARLGWNNRIRGADTLAMPARYTISLPAGLAADWELGDPSATLDLLVAGVDGEPDPRSPASDSTSNDADDPGEAAPEPEDEADDGTEPAIDLSVEVMDVSGYTAHVRLSDYGPIRRPLDIRVRRRNDAEEFDAQWELVLQSFTIPLADFAAQNPDLDLTALRSVGLVFDLTEAGTIMLDDVGFSHLPPGFLSDR